MFLQFTPIWTSNSLILTVPEPSTLALLGIAVAAMFAGYWRRRGRM